MNEYERILSNDPRYQSAKATGQRIGAGHEGLENFHAPPISGRTLLLLALLAVVALIYGWSLAAAS